MFMASDHGTTWNAPRLVLWQASPLSIYASAPRIGYLMPGVE